MIKVITIILIAASSLAADTIKFHPRIGWPQRMNGGVFEGSDSVNGPYTVIYTIPATPLNGWNQVDVDLGMHKYLRYRATAPYSYCNVAEIEFWRGGQRVQGVGFGTPGTWPGIDSTFAKALDGDVNTFFNPPSSYGTEHVGIEVTTVIPTPSPSPTPSPPIGTSSPFGVMTHFAQFDNPDVMPVIEQAGIQNIRDEQYWQAVEGTKGTFAFPAQYMNYMSAASASGITPLIVLDWSNSNYDTGYGQFTFPYTYSGRKGFAKYAVEVLKKFPGQIPAVEVWNEVNAGTFISGPATVDKPLYYTVLLRETYETIKASFPGVKVVAGATVPVAHGFFKGIFEQGAMPYLDAVSVHPYVNPEVVALQLSELREMVKSYNDGVEKPIWVTEFSRSVNSEAEREDAAVYTAQMAIIMLSERVEKMFYYLMIDQGSFRYRGLVGAANDPRGKYFPNPAYCAYATVIDQLEGASFVSRYPIRPSTYAFKFSNGVSAIWAIEPMTVNIATSAPVTVISMHGEETSVNPVGGFASLPVTNSPQYIKGQFTSIQEANNNLVADAASGYSKTQGVNGWSYGYATVTGTYSPSLFVPMTWKIWGGDNFRWVGPGQYHFMTESDAHPDSRWVIRRWTSDVETTVRVSGKIVRGGGGDGVNARIFIDGVEAFMRHINPGETVNYDVPIPVKFGSTIDFAIDQGADNSFDATTFTSRIHRF